VGYNIQVFTFYTKNPDVYCRRSRKVWGKITKIYTNMEKLNLQNVSRETLEKKYFELLEIQSELKDYQIEIENVLFLPF